MTHGISMIKALIMISLLTLLTACGGAPRLEKPNKDLPALIEIIRLDTGEQQIHIRLTYRQAKPRDASTMACAITFIDNSPLTLETIPIPKLTAYAREVLQLNLPEDASIPSQTQIKYTLTCTLTTPKSRAEKIVNHGTLYRLANQSPAIYR